MRAEGNNQQPFINVLLSFQIAIIHLHTQVLDPRPAATTWFTINLWSQEKIRKYLIMCCQNGSDQTSGWSHSSGPCVGYTQVFKPAAHQILRVSIRGDIRRLHCAALFWVKAPTVHTGSGGPNSRCIDLTVKVLTYGNVAWRPHFAPIYTTVGWGLCRLALTISTSCQSPGKQHI